MNSEPPSIMRLRPPFYIGCPVVVHDGCWASELTRKFSNIRLYNFVTGIDERSYEVYAIIKPKNEADSMDDVTRDGVMSFINNHPLVKTGIPLFQSGKEIIAQVRVEDLGGPRGVIRIVRLFGAIVTEIGQPVEDGKEYVYGLFSSKSSYKACLDLLEKIYGAEAVIKDECDIGNNVGLELDPPIFEEVIVCNRVKYENQRILIDYYLKTGEVHAEASEKTTEELVPKLLDLIRKYGPIMKKVVVWLLEICFPQLPPLPDP